MNLADARSHDGEDVSDRIEADRLEVDPGFRHSRTMFGSKMASSSTRSREAFKWVWEIDLATSFEQLSISTLVMRAAYITFETLDSRQS